MEEYGSATGKITPALPSLSGELSPVDILVGTLTVSTKEILYWETSNQSGGTTVYIGKEV